MWYKHKTRLSVNDKRFLRANRIEPFECIECERKPKELPPPKLRIEEKPKDEEDGS